MNYLSILFTCLLFISTKFINIKSSILYNSIHSLKFDNPISRVNKNKTSIESYIYEAISTNLKELIYDSPVPVLVDVYATWCEPCKQLSELLEQAAVDYKDKLRVVKCNCDTEREIAGLLNVTSLPTVFAISKGIITERSIGSMHFNQLDQFIRRLLSRYNEFSQNEFSSTITEELYILSDKLKSFTGMNVLSFKNKNKLSELVKEAFQLSGMFDNQSTQISESLQFTIK